VGHSNWQTDEITVVIRALAEGGPEPNANYLAALAQKISMLVKHVFLSCKPMQPAQARWTGVANVGSWALGLRMFHKLLTAIVKNLQLKGDKDNDDNLDMDVPDLYLT
jgi:hypothetical protein